MNQRHTFVARLFSLTLCLALCGCLPHSIGGANVSGKTHAPASEIVAGKTIHVALSDPLPPDLSDTPAFITAQFCKYLAPVASSVSAGDAAKSVEAALAEARENKSHYLALVRLMEWKSGSILAPGPRVHVEVSIIEVATGKVLSRHQIEARCYAMLAGLEASPRECARPQVEVWIQQVFTISAGTVPYADPANFPR